MAWRTVATPVALVRSTIILMVVCPDVGIMMIASDGRMAAVVVIGGQRAHRSRATCIRAAQRHDRRSVCLERHREHQEPQQDCAKADHRQIVGERPRASFA